MLERITFTNYFAREIALPVRVDFRDMFAVRGATRSHRGRAHDALIGEASVTFRYEGLDNVGRQSVIAEPDQVHSSYAEFRIVVPSRDRRILHLDGRSRRRDSVQ
ncbi:glycogen debranching N-terminal domain-containing protein [Mesorhizobium sp. M0895]|uniref:glycogen debranching N-terminal domain-containing protein n=1 Tax=Mesorhizobium sp. M0895 TaxID=2957019 RepID=UPI00333929CF